MARETLDIYAPFAHRFGLGNVKWELEDLAFKYLNPEAYNRLKTALNTKRKSREEYIERTIAPLRERLEAEGMKFDIYGRAKHLYSIYNKMRMQNKTLDEIHDLVAIRIILDTPNPNECFTVYGIVSEIFTPVPEQFKNYISVPKKNGYQSIHTTVIGPDGRQVEVQIRTRTMHEVAERGIAAHFKYKERTLNPSVVVNEDKQLEEWADWIRDIFERASDESASQEVLESFRLNLFQDEIYVFTPKGDLRILPKGATPIDFAYDIHSEVGYHCIGAKVNGRIVPLDTQMKSGDQVEILTSKNQTPSADWEKIAVTHKARSGIRRWLNDQRRKHVQQGREQWEKRAKKEKLHINDDELERISHAMKYESRGDFFSDIGAGKISPDEAVAMVLEKLRQPGQREDVTSLNGQLLYDRFVREARTTSQGVMIDGSVSGIKYNYAKCCNPIPGDHVIGVVKTGRGVTIHRATCKNALIMMQEPDTRNRTLDVSWGTGTGHDFMAAIRVSGEDRPGMLNDLTHAILSYQNTNMRSVNIESQDSLFEGVITVMVKNIEHLNRLIDRLRKVRNVRQVERFEQATLE
jgi:guanosine-3',5'-bis(diphosphate) 3'-pyrophosphohydrolase